MIADESFSKYGKINLMRLDNTLSTSIRRPNHLGGLLVRSVIQPNVRYAAMQIKPIPISGNIKS